MSSLRDHVAALINRGEQFTYENFAKHGFPVPCDDEDPDWGRVSSSRTYPEAVSPEFNEWLSRTGTVLLKAHGENHHDYKLFDQKRHYGLVGNDEGLFLEVRNDLLGALRGLAADLDGGVVHDPGIPNRHSPSAADVRLVCERFHRVVVQLRRRREERTTLDVADEYDAQDLLRSLLALYFDDIRPEEWTPSYAGSSARMDFLLKGSGIVVEVKRTRKGLADKELGTQLIEDVARYQGHHECKHLICFVYDPENRVLNPGGLTKDIEVQSRKGLEVEVIVVPRP